MPRNKHSSPRRVLTATAEEWATWDLARGTFTWAEWARAALNVAAQDARVDELELDDLPRPMLIRMDIHQLEPRPRAKRLSRGR